MIKNSTLVKQYEDIIEHAIDYWHYEEESNISLENYLNMTWDEYKSFIETPYPSNIENILQSKIERFLVIAEKLKNNQDLTIAELRKVVL